MRRYLTALLFAFLVVGGSGCGRQESNRAYVARVGDSYLSQEDVLAALSAVPPGLDSTHAAQQVIDRWVTDELLSQEAVRRRLQEDPEVVRRLADNERSVLISTLVDRLYREVEPASEREIASYFERNRDNLLLREPFLRIRYMTTSDSTAAAEALVTLDSLALSPNPDSTWNGALLASADDPEESAVLSTSYFPASRLFRNVPHLLRAVTPLAAGESTTIFTEDGQFHVIQLVDRVQAGTTPEMEWIVEDIRNRVLIDRRKQMYIDQVQRLRNRALAEGLLEVRE